MWKVIELDQELGMWKEHGIFQTSQECKEQFAQFTNADNVYAFWNEAFPVDLNEQNKLIDEILAVNNQRISRITIGIDLNASNKDPSISSCPGNCFCVIAHGMRRCETYYCNVNNVCAWVPCGYSC